MTDTDPGIPNPEEATAPSLPAEQLKHMVEYVTGAADQGYAMQSYESAVRTNARISEQHEQDATLGEIAVTAAAAGSLIRDRAGMAAHCAALTDRMVHQMGLDPAHATLFFDMQNHLALQPRDSGHIFAALAYGIGLLERREEQKGEDATKAKVAFLASGFAAIQDIDLRNQIYDDLSSL